jgi:hypothetical protein
MYDEMAETKQVLFHTREARRMGQRCGKLVALVVGSSLQVRHGNVCGEEYVVTGGGSWRPLTPRTGDARAREEKRKCMQTRMTIRKLLTPLAPPYRESAVPGS